MGIINSIANILFGFIYRTIFVYVLAKEYLGLNGLFTNILSILSIAELGIGSAINFRLYKPVAVDDKARIIKLMNFYKRVYLVVATVVAIVGFSLMPVLKFLIADTSEIPSDVNIYVLYTLFLLGQVSTYICVHKQSIIIADQKAWIISLSNLVGQLLKYGTMIIVLFATKQFTLVLVAQIVSALLVNIGITILANHMYPFIKNSKDMIDKEERKTIYKETGALLNHRIGGAVVNGTDNILISSFVGLGILGLYSNYSLILSSVSALMSQFISSLTASIGNQFVTCSNEDVYKTYFRVQYFNVFISAFVMTSFCVLMNNFIEIWLGEEFVMDMSFVIVISISNIIRLFRNPNLIFINSCGLYMKDKWRPIIEVVVNLTVSIILVQFMGLSGIFIGTIISTLTVPMWREYYLLNKHVFKTKKFTRVIVFQILIIAFSVILCVGYYYLFRIMSNSIGWFLLKILICLIAFPLLYVALTFWMPQFRYFKGLVIRILLQIKNKITHKNVVILSDGEVMVNDKLCDEEEIISNNTDYHNELKTKDNSDNDETE